MSVNSDCVNNAEYIARSIQDFLYDGKSPKKENVVKHTEKEMFDMLEDLRQQAWEDYNNARRQLGIN